MADGPLRAENRLFRGDTMSLRGWVVVLGYAFQGLDAHSYRAGGNTMLLAAAIVAVFGVGAFSGFVLASMFCAPLRTLWHHPVPPPDPIIHWPKNISIETKPTEEIPDDDEVTAILRAAGLERIDGKWMPLEPPPYYRRDRGIV